MRLTCESESLLLFLFTRCLAAVHFLLLLHLLRAGRHLGGLVGGGGGGQKSRPRCPARGFGSAVCKNHLSITKDKIRHT